MSKANINDLFGNALQDDAISQKTHQTFSLPNFGNAINEAIGFSVNNYRKSKTRLITLLIDDSWSIEVAGNSQMVRDNVNFLLESFGFGAPDPHAVNRQYDEILICCRYLNGTVLYDYVPLSEAVLLTEQNYSPNGGTPLYDQISITAGLVIAKRQEFEDAGVVVHSNTLIFTDGNDEHSRDFQHPEDLSHVITDLTNNETNRIMCAGYDDGRTDYTDVFTRMGFHPESIKLPKNAKELRREFNMFSQASMSSPTGTSTVGFGV